MSKITSPILLDSTGQEANKIFIEIDLFKFICYNYIVFCSEARLRFKF